MIMLRLKLAIISFSLVGLIVPNFKNLDAPTEDVKNDYNDTSTKQNSSDSGLEKMTLIAQFKPEENEFLGKDGRNPRVRTTPESGNAIEVIFPEEGTYFGNDHIFLVAY